MKYCQKEVSEIITVSVRLSSDFLLDQDSIISSLPFGENEKSRLKSIKNLSYRSQSIAALVALKDVLPTSPESDFTISRTANRKPYFDNLPLHFSISHSNSLSVASIGETPLGVDIELLDNTRDTSRLVSRFFNEEEKSRLNASPSFDTEFYSIWTKKEALSKISGEGLPDLASQNSLSCFCHQYILKLGNENYIMSVCASREEEIVINNAYKELTVYEL